MPSSISDAVSKFRVKDPLPAVLYVGTKRSEYVSLPVGGVLTSARDFVASAIGMLSVIYDHREYSVLGSDLLRKCERCRL